LVYYGAKEEKIKEGKNQIVDLFAASKWATCFGINAGSRQTKKSHTPNRPQLLIAATHRLAA
jgi:hypothetical protein